MEKRSDWVVGRPNLGDVRRFVWGARGKKKRGGGGSEIGSGKRRDGPVRHGGWALRCAVRRFGRVEWWCFERGADAYVYVERRGECNG